MSTVNGVQPKDMFPTRPPEWSRPPLGDTTISSEAAKATVRENVIWKRIKRFFAKPYDRVELPGLHQGKNLYLGQTPDQSSLEKVPQGCLYVSVLKPSEEKEMSGSTKDFRKVISVENGGGMSPEQLDLAVEALRAALVQPNDTPVYLNCWDGVGQGPSVLAAYRMKYESRTVDDAIKCVQEDRPSAKLKAWFGWDNQHTKALRAYQDKLLESREVEWSKARVEQLNKHVIKHLGEGVLSQEEIESLNTLVFENKELESALNQLQLGWRTTLVSPTRGYDEVKRRRQVDALRLTSILDRLAADFPVASKLSKIFYNRFFTPDLLFTDSFQGLLISDPNEAPGRLRQLIRQPGASMPSDVQSFLKTELGINDGQPFWEIPHQEQTPGRLSSHAGWISESVPTETEAKPLVATRTMGFREGNRARVGSAKLSLPALTLAQAKQVMAAIQRKMEFPEECFGARLPKEFPARLWVEATPRCTKFIEECTGTTEKMLGEILKLGGNVTHTMPEMRNVNGTRSP